MAQPDQPAHPTQPASAIRTSRPVLPRDFVARDRLAARAHAGSGVTLVVAPAGFGKTVLLADLAGRSRETVAWLSLGMGEAAPDRFVHRLVGAVRESAPGFGESALAQLRSSFDAALIAERLADDLLALPRPLLLILDDLHAAPDPFIAELIGHLIRWQPPKLHLAIGSRTEPGIPLSRARALGLVEDIGPEDLRFTPQETAAFFAAQPLATLGDDFAARVWNLTEGWPIALRIHAAALRDASPRPSWDGRPPEELSRPLREFLIDEVLQLQSEADRDAMLMIALPEAVDVDLCSRLCGLDYPAAARLLDRLAYTDRLLAAESGGAFSYHALLRLAFRERLAARIGLPGVEELHRRLGQAFADRGDVLAAIGHFLAGGGEADAVALVERAVPDALFHGESSGAGHWLAALPEPLLRRSATLLLARAALQSLQGNEAASNESLRLAEGAHAAGEAENADKSDENEARRRWFASAVAALDAENFRWLGDLDAGVERMRDAAIGLGADRSVYHMMAVSMEAAMLRLGGRTAEAVEALREAEAPPGSPPEAMTARLAMHRALMELHRGRPDLALTPARVAARNASDLGMTGVWAGSQAWLGVAHLLRLEVDEASEALPAAVAHRSLVGIFHDHESTLAWSLLLHVRRRGEDAAAPVHRFILETAGETDRRWQGDALSFLARLAILDGDLEAARRWLSRRDEIGETVPLHLVESPNLTGIHVGLAAGGDEARQAMERLSALLPELDRAGYPVDSIRARLLLAVGRKALKRSSREIAAPLAEAAELAASGGLLLPFAEFQAPLGRLLRESGRAGARIDAEVTAVIGSKAPRGAFAGDHLTPRERQVLLSLRDGLSNKEIGTRLSISVVTVKRHTVSLYRKLGVEGRVAAVRVAAARGLLDA